MVETAEEVDKKVIMMTAPDPEEEEEEMAEENPMEEAVVEESAENSKTLADASLEITADFSIFLVVAEVIAKDTVVVMKAEDLEVDPEAEVVVEEVSPLDLPPQMQHLEAKFQS